MSKAQCLRDNKRRLRSSNLSPNCQVVVVAVLCAVSLSSLVGAHLRFHRERTRSTYAYAAETMITSRYNATEALSASGKVILSAVVPSNSEYEIEKNADHPTL